MKMVYTNLLFFEFLILYMYWKLGFMYQKRINTFVLNYTCNLSPVTCVLVYDVYI